MSSLTLSKPSDSKILHKDLYDRAPTTAADPVSPRASRSSLKGPTPAEIILSLLRKDSNGRYCNVFETLTSVQILKLAYETIKSKPGNMVRGTTKETLDGITEEWFINTSRSLRSERYSFSPNRRVYIPKPNGKRRPLGIATPREKIVQQAMRMVMETVLEPTFLDSSHGFRPGRGCHTALREVKKNWRGAPWIIEGDIKSFFDSIDHQILAGLLSKHFAEKRLFNLYWKFVNAGYVEFHHKKKSFFASDFGVPQGGIISPLFSNVILHELDVFIEKRRLEYESRTVGPPKLKNPVYAKYSRLIYKHEKTNARADLLAAVKLRNRTSSSIANPKHIQIRYVRYADDWLVGLWGTKQQALSLKSDIADFLKSIKLALSEEKTLITNTRRSSLKFLGTYIRRLTPHNGRLRCPTTAGTMRMTAPMDILLKRLQTKSFCKPGTTWLRPLAITEFLGWPIKDLILRFRTIFAGFRNYYSFADNIGSLSYIYYLLHGSLRSTICRKMDIGHRAFYAIFGPNISISVYHSASRKFVPLDFPCPPLVRNPLNFNGPHERDPLSIKDWKVSTITALGQCCANCASTHKVQMHHVRHIRTSNTKLDSFTKLMSIINRKQVPLCAPCHLKVHKGEYAGMSLQHFQYIKWKGTAKWA